MASIANNFFSVLNGIQPLHRKAIYSNRNKETSMFEGTNGIKEELKPYLQLLVSKPL